MASDNRKESQQRPGTSDSRSASQQITKTSDASARTHSLKPSGLLLKVDFEDEEVKPLKKKEDTYDQLVLYTPKGQRSAVGIMYQGGNNNDRRARIVTDPTNKDNKVFHYWLKNARAPGQSKGKYKGRIQMNLSGLDKTSVYQRFRMYLHPDIAFYNKYPDMNLWFTVNEMWMGDKWKKHPYPFRLSLNIAKPKGAGKPLYFIASGGISAGESKNKREWEEIWVESGANFEIPIGEWLDIEIGYKAGDINTGHFYMGVKRENEDNFTTVFDITNWTYHPDSPEVVPMTSWQPLKIYTSSKIVDFIRKNGGVTQLYFDDLEIYDNW